MSKMFGGKPKKSQAQVDAERRQAEELRRLEGEEAKRKNAAKRRRMGRASLISGDERGVRDTLG